MGTPLSKTRLYRIWSGIKQRCYNEHTAIYRLYGKRGILMCDEWKESFQAFHDWSMEHGYKDPPKDGSQERALNLTIDRIDDEKGYTPENCQWITMRANVMKKRPYANYRSKAGKNFIMWLESECEKTVDDVFKRERTFYGARQIRNFIAFSLVNMLGISRLTMLEEEHIPTARAFSEKVLTMMKDVKPA